MLDERSRQSTASANRSSTAGVIGHNPIYGQFGNMSTNGSVNAYHRGRQMYMHPQNQDNNGTRNDGLSILGENFNKMNIVPHQYHPSSKPNQPMNNQTYDGGVSVNSLPQAFMHGGQYLYGGQHYPAQSIQQHGMANGFGMYPGYINPAQLPYAQNFLGSHSPVSTGFAGSSRVPSGDVPSLITPGRGGSNSSQEGDAPGTPLTHYTSQGNFRDNVAVIGRSPEAMYSTWTTPSPSQGPFKHQHRSSISPRLQLLVKSEPAIPHAVPAPYSPVKPLDRSLENPHGITNVYIRGLLPDTTDEKLKALAGRFGDVISHKSIIDHATGECKGFGFVKFYNFKDAEDCIRGFHSLGYESSFARESFYSQLKKLHDDGNTNLYVSNLPKDMNEHELGAIFAPHKVCSSRILRDGQGNGRGVGFARFETRDVCEDIIKNFNNTPVSKAGGEEHLIQIRYADTPDQKHLKQQTTAARQYRTAEYESVTHGRTPFMSPARATSTNGESVPRMRPGFENYQQGFEEYMKNAGGIRDLSRDGLRERLTSVSTQLRTPGGSVSLSVDVPDTRAMFSESNCAVAKDVNGEHDDSETESGARQPNDAATTKSIAV